MYPGTEPGDLYRHPGDCGGGGAVLGLQRAGMDAHLPGDRSGRPERENGGMDLLRAAGGLLEGSDRWKHRSIDWILPQQHAVDSHSDGWRKNIDRNHKNNCEVSV